MSKQYPAFIGLITGISMILASLLSWQVLELPIENNFQLLVYAIMTAGITFCLFKYSQLEQEKRSFKDFFGIGFRVFVVIALLMALFTFIYFSIHTEFRDEKIAENTKLILQEGNHLKNEVAENEQQLKKMFMPIMISSAVFRYLILGAILTAITGGFLSQQKSKLPS